MNTANGPDDNNTSTNPDQLYLPAALLQLEKFTGNTSSKFDSFIKNLESVYSMHLLSDTNRVILLNNHLRGAAKDFAQLPQNDHLDYEELKRRLSKKFRVHVPAAESRKNFFGARQMLGESVTDFADRVVSLAHQIESEDLTIGRKERKRVFVAGLHPAIRSRVFDHHQEDWDTLVDRAQGVEDNEREFSLTKEEGHQRELEKLTKRMTEMYEEIRELRRAQDTTKKQENNREYRQHYNRGTYNRDQRRNDQSAGNRTTQNHSGSPQHNNGPRTFRRPLPTRKKLGPACLRAGGKSAGLLPAISVAVYNNKDSVPLMHKLIIDTGSEANIFNLKLVNKDLFELNKPIMLKGLGGFRVPSEGSSLVEIGAEINGKAIRNVRTTFEFCDLGFADYNGILGMPGIRALRLTMSHDGTITSQYEKKGDPCSSAFKSPIIAKELEALPPRLPIDQIRTGEDVVRAFPHCFCDGISDMGEGSTITAPELRMLSAKPIHKRQYPIPAITVPKVKALVKELEEVGIVEECTSLWNSPLFPVAKSDGSVRITLDLRLINDATEFFPFPIPRVEDNLRAFAGAKVFSTLDLTSGFFQIHIPECDRDYFDFSLPWGRYRFARLAQGAKNSAQIFQWAMNIVLGDLLFKCVRLYIDDVIVYSSSFEQHVADLAAVLERLNKFRLRAKRAKSYFFRDSVEYLGHTIDQEGIKPLYDNVAALRDMPRPKNIRAVRSLLGMVNYYRRFVPNAGEVLAPLSNLLKKGHKFFWGTAEQAAFEIIKKVLTSEPVLVHPVPSKPFILNTDASGIAVGACLQQEVQGVVKPVAYYSKRLSGPETRYSTIEKEAYAVVLALQHFKHLIAGSSIEVLTDHKPITYNKGSDYKNARLSRWAEIIQEFRVTFAYVPGKDNRVADFLSRFPCSNDLSTLEDNRVVAAVTIEQGSPLLSNDEVWSELKSDPKWSPLITRIETRVGTGIIPHKHKEYMRKDGCLYVYNDQGNWVKVIPRSLINRVMGYHHNIASGGHFGVRKTLRRLRSEYFWPRMRTEVQNYIRRCENCQFSNQGASKAANAPHFRPMQPFEHIAIDFIGPLETTPQGHNSILSIMDLFTKYPILVPTRDQTAGTVVKALVDRVITHHGEPKTVLSDRGSAFISQVFKGVCKALGISAVNTTAWRPQSNGAVERQNRTVIESLRRCACGSNWDNILSMVAFAIRSTEHASTGYTPAKLLYGYELRQPQPFEELRGYPIINDSINHYATAYKHQIAEKMETAREKVRQTYLKGQDEAGAKFAESKLRVFPEGQLVLVERMHETKGRHKLEPRYEGPFFVLERTGETVYLLEDTKSGKRDKFHVDRMKAYYEPIRTYPLNSTNNQEQESEEDEEFCSTNPGFVNFFYPLSKSAVPPSSNQTAQVQSSDNGQNSSAIRRSTPPPFSPQASGEMSLEATNLVWAGSPHRAEHEPGRLGFESQAVAEISADNQSQDEKSRIANASGDYVNLPFDRQHVNFAAACIADVTPSTSGALAAATNWAEQMEAAESAEDGFTVVKHKRRRRESPSRPVEQRSSGVAASRRTGPTPRRRPPAGGATAAVEELVGGAGNVLQVMKMDGHMLVGLSTKALAERLIRDGLDIGHTHLRAFPFKKRAERITVGNLPFFVDDAAVIEALKPYGDVTSIVPIRLRAGRYTFTDGRREAFILLKEGIALEKIPTRVIIRNKGNVLSAFISYGVKCSRCGRQGHRRANCPIIPGRASNNAQPQPAPLPSGASSTESRQPNRPTPTAPAPSPKRPAPQTSAPGTPTALPARTSLDAVAPPSEPMEIAAEVLAPPTSNSAPQAVKPMEAPEAPADLALRPPSPPEPGGNSNIYKVLRQVLSELRTGQAAVPPTSTLPAPRPFHPTPLTSHKKKLTPAMITPPAPAPTQMGEVVPMTEVERCVPPLPAPQPAEPAPPAPQESTPATTTPPLPPPAPMEDDDDLMPELDTIFNEMITDPGFEPLLEPGISLDAVMFAVLYREDRLDLLGDLSPEQG
ncbi:K02A2.6-like, partial [Cordylochernes scorpioides]